MAKKYSDTVFIEGLRLVGKHGVLARERHVEQEFILDIRVMFDARRGAKSDKLSDTLDYMYFKKIAEDVMKGPHNYLIEKIASRIADKILEDHRVQEAHITVRKPAVISNGVAGISITREQRIKYNHDT